MGEPGPNEIDRAYEVVWEEFVTRGTTEPAFASRSSADILHLVLLCPVGASPAALSAILPIQQRVAFPYADLVPSKRLHVSIQGFDVKVADWRERRAEVLLAARTLFSRVRPFTLRLGWLTAFPMAAILRVEEGGLIRRLRAELRRVLPEWAGLERDPLVQDGVDRWLPHLSLAYFNAEHDNRALIKAIEPQREKVVTEVQAREVHLISTPPDLTGSDRWRWPLHDVFSLGRE